MNEFYEAIDITRTLDVETEEEIVLKFLGYQTSQVWIFFLKEFQIWNIDTGQRIKRVKHKDGFRRDLAKPILLNKNTAIFSYFSQKTQPFHFIATYNLQEQQIKIWGKIPKLSCKIEYFSFKESNICIMIDKQQSVSHCYFLSLNQNSDQNNLLTADLKFDKTYCKFLKYNEVGTLCLVSKQDNNKQFQFQFMKSQKEIGQKYNIIINGEINEIKKFSDTEAMICYHDNNYFIIKYSLKHEYILQTIESTVKILKIFAINNYWICQNYSGKNKHQHKLQNIFLNDASFSISLKFNALAQKSEYFHAIFYANKCYINTTDMQIGKLYIKIIKVVRKKKINLIHLLQESGLVQIFGNQIVKQVINTSI